MTIRVFLIFTALIFSSNAFSSNIRVLDFQKVIENNSNLFLLYEKIENDQRVHKEKFNSEEIFFSISIVPLATLNTPSAR